MKADSLLKIFAFAITCLVARTPSMGEMFYGPTSTTNQFVIGPNEAVTIDTIVAFDHYLGVSVTTSNITYLAQVNGDLEGHDACNSSPFAFAGPSTLRFTNAAAIRFTRLTNSSIHMLISDGTSTNTSVFVPKGKTIELLCAMGGRGSCEYFPVTLHTPALIYGPLALRAGQRLEGPMTIEFDTAEFPATQHGLAVIGSYCFLEDAGENPRTWARRRPGQ